MQNTEGHEDMAEQDAAGPGARAGGASATPGGAAGGAGQTAGTGASAADAPVAPRRWAGYVRMLGPGIVLALASVGASDMVTTLN